MVVMSNAALDNKSEHTPEQFSAACAEWLVKAQAELDSSSWRKGQTLSLESGKRYVRVVVSDKHGSRSAFGFIDSFNGNVLKSAGWKAPAKNFPRGNIYTAHVGCQKGFSIG